MFGSNLIVANPRLYFVEDIVIEILSRLPVKSLIRFTVVCKKWKALIESLSFIFKHMTLSKRKRILTFNLGDSFENRAYAISLHVDDDLCEPINLNLPFLRQISYFKILGVSNGLVFSNCSSNSFDFVICNLSTNQFHKIPSSKFWDTASIMYAASGFSSDFKSGDYKLVNLMWYYDDDQRLVKKAEVYTMSTDSWREIDNQALIGDNIAVFRNSAFATNNGVLYWECLWLPSFEAVILSFDMSDESFGLIEVPLSFKRMYYDGNCKLTQIKEELAILKFDIDGSYTVRTLNEHSKGWEMKFSGETLPIIAKRVVVDETDVINYVRCENAAYIANEDYDFKSGKDKLLVFNLESREIKIIPIDELGHNYQVYWYTESLFPVKKNDRVSQNA